MLKNPYMLVNECGADFGINPFLFENNLGRKLSILENMNLDDLLNRANNFNDVNCPLLQKFGG